MSLCIEELLYRRTIEELLARLPLTNRILLHAKTLDFTTSTHFYDPMASANLRKTNFFSI